MLVFETFKNNLFQPLDVERFRNFFERPCRFWSLFSYFYLRLPYGKLHVNMAKSALVPLLPFLYGNNNVCLATNYL